MYSVVTQLPLASCWSSNLKRWVPSHSTLSSRLTFRGRHSAIRERNSILQLQMRRMPQGMEPEVRKYLFKVLNSLCYGLLWMALNVLGGLYWGYATINGKLSVGNILFFTWFILSLTALLYSFYRIWSTTTPSGKDWLAAVNSDNQPKSIYLSKE